jgi:peptide/nickel transport system substrate-binding protein
MTHMKKYLKRQVTLAFLLTLLLSSVAAANAGSNAEMRELPPKYGGTIIIGILTDVTHLNPAISTSYYIDTVSGQIYNSLMEYDYKTLEPVPELAKSWDISEDGLTYTFHLEEDVYWHDGEPFTSEDVKFTFEEITIPFHPRGAATFGGIAFEAPDEHTFVMKLENSYAPLINYFTLWYVGIMPKHIYEGTDIINNPHNWEDPVGTGPFLLDEWVKGSHIKLVRNPNYWRKGKPYLDSVIFKIIPDTSSRLLAFENHEIDYVPLMIPNTELKRLNATEGINVVSCGAFGSMHTIQNNLENEYLSDIRVRKAIAYAIDKDQFNELVLDDLFKVATGPLPSTSWAYNPDVEKYEQNITLANSLLDEAGFPRGDDGNRFSLRMIIGTTGRDKGVPEMEIMRSQLSEVGIDLQLEVYDEATTTQMVSMEQDFDMYLIAGLSTAPDPNMISGYLHSNRILKDDPIPGLYNVMNYNNSRVDELFELGKVETDAETRKEIYGELQEIVVDELPCYYLIEDQYFHFYWEDYVGIPAGPYGGARERLDSAWWTGGSESSPEEIAETIAEVEAQLEELAAEDYDVTAATAKLEEAKEALENGDYADAVTFASEVIDLAEAPEEEPANQGIPGFPVSSMALGLLMSVALIMFFTKPKTIS